MVLPGAGHGSCVALGDEMEGLKDGLLYRKRTSLIPENRSELVTLPGNRTWPK